MVNDITIAATVAGPLVASLGLLFLGLQIRDARRLARAQFISTLENDLVKYYDTYERLLPGEVWSNEGTGPATKEEITRIVRYLGFFAKLKFLLDLGVLDLATIDKMFVFRFFLVVNNRHVQEQVLHADLYDGYWSEIFALHQQWSGYRRERSLPIPFSSTSL